MVYTQEQRDRIVELRNQGLPYKKIAEICGIPVGSCSRIFSTDTKTISFHPSEIDKERVTELRKQGLTYVQIAKEVGFSVGTVRSICVYAGLTETPIQKRDKYICELRAKGLNYDEISKEIGVSKDIIKRVCCDNGCTYSKEELINIQREYGWISIKSQIETAEENLIKKLNDRFIYLGGYTNTDCKVELVCEECCNDFTVTAQAIRKGMVQECPVCRAFEREERRWLAEKERLYRENQRDWEREERKYEREQERLNNLETRMCEICGKEFVTTRNSIKVCCSAECSHKKANRNSTHRKDKRIPEDKRVDKDITAKSLFKRDKGICWICGGQCNLEDYTMRNGYFIAGDWYPSVDHIVPICEGGEDSWENVKLAHRWCNMARYCIESKN